MMSWVPYATTSAIIFQWQVAVFSLTYCVLHSCWFALLCYYLKLNCLIMFRLTAHNFLVSSLKPYQLSNVLSWCWSLENSGNPALRQGKPGSGVGLGYGLRFKSQFGHFQVDYAVNAFQQKTLYFGLSNLASWDPYTKKLQNSSAFL